MNRASAKRIAIGTLSTAKLMANLKSGVQDCMSGFVFGTVGPAMKSNMAQAISAVLNAAAPPGVPVDLMAQHVTLDFDERERGKVYVTVLPGAPRWAHELVDKLTN